MMRGPAHPILRQIEVLYRGGSLAGLTDVELVERFRTGQRGEREDAFAVLVIRHGPMVFRVCLRMLPSSIDAEDAFQVVFLVLARKAGRIGDVEALPAWLHGVAVRTSKEARRRSAIRRMREGGIVDDASAATIRDEGRDERLLLLDEELARLPGRYREPLRLCELEGISRRDAARRLGLAEGTLSSRLSRARSLLRDRLRRRGIATTTGTFPASFAVTAQASLPERLVDLTVHLASNFATRGLAQGIVPAGIASMAEGVLAMMRLSRWKSLFLAAASLGVGLGWAMIPIAAKYRPSVDPSHPATLADEVVPGPNQTALLGLVVDEAGEPVSGAEVRFAPFAWNELKAKAGRDGGFSLLLDRSYADGFAVRARSPDGLLAGHQPVEFTKDRFETEVRLRIVVKPTRVVEARVVDGRENPVADAAVIAVGDRGNIDESRTGGDGSAIIRLSADDDLRSIVALKPGLGVDYTEFGRPVSSGAPNPKVDIAGLPSSIRLRIVDHRTIRIRAKDRLGKPMSGLHINAQMIKRQDRIATLFVSSRSTEAETDSDGFATFDWLPPHQGFHDFEVHGRGVTPQRIGRGSERGDLIEATLNRSVRIRGRVFRPDGRGVGGVTVEARGSGQGDGRRCWTTPEGSYAMDVPGEDFYMIAVRDDEWAAPSRRDLLVSEGDADHIVDFELDRGTVLRGRVTAGSGSRAVEDHEVLIGELGNKLPRITPPLNAIDLDETRRYLVAKTDAEGRYSVRVGPGSFTIRVAPSRMIERLEVKGEAEIVRDFRFARLDRGYLSGRVVRSSRGNEGVAGARVEIVPRGEGSDPSVVYTDESGRFRASRALEPLTVDAMSPDGASLGSVDVGPTAETTSIAISPISTASATGVMLDSSGRPASGREVRWGRLPYDDRRPPALLEGDHVTTDEAGRFVLPNLRIGERYEMGLVEYGIHRRAGRVTPDRPGSIDLGVLVAGSPRPGPDSPPAAVGSSAFRDDALPPGSDAPEIDVTTFDGKAVRLADSRGKFVLVHVWALWCWPCMENLDRIKVLSEKYGRGDRLSILGLNVDESIETPRSFRARELPGIQAFLGGHARRSVFDRFGIRAIPACILVGPDGKIIARGMRGAEIDAEVEMALASGH